MRITQAAERAGVSSRALRYYEEEGLLRPSRGAGGHREYTEALIDRVRLILRLRAAGLDMKSVRMALSCIDADTTSPEAIDHLYAVRNRLTDHIESTTRSRNCLDELIVAATTCTNGNSRVIPR